MKFHLVSIFPDIFKSYLNESILKRAQKSGLASFAVYDPRDFTKNKHKKVDDKPYGGGPGMVMQAEPIIKAVKKAVGRKKKVKVLITSPRGKQFTNKMAQKWAKDYSDLVIICGRYEGIDERVKKVTKAEEISIGPFVLTGGELPAMVMIDSVTRQIPGVLGNNDSLEESRDERGEVYTRPEVLKIAGKNYKVPKVLTEGDHKKINAWRKGI